MENKETEIRLACLQAVARELYKRYKEAYPSLLISLYTEARSASIYIKDEISVLMFFSCRLTLFGDIEIYWVKDRKDREDKELSIGDDYLQEIGFKKIVRDYGFRWQFSSTENILKLITHFPDDPDIIVAVF